MYLVSIIYHFEIINLIYFNFNVLDFSYHLLNFRYSIYLPTKILKRAIKINYEIQLIIEFDQ